MCSMLLGKAEECQWSRVLNNVTSNEPSRAYKQKTYCNISGWFPFTSSAGMTAGYLATKCSHTLLMEMKPRGNGDRGVLFL